MPIDLFCKGRGGGEVLPVYGDLSALLQEDATFVGNVFRETVHARGAGMQARMPGQGNLPGDGTAEDRMKTESQSCRGMGDPITNICPLCGEWDRNSRIAWEQATPEQRKTWDLFGAPDNGFLDRWSHMNLVWQHSRPCWMGKLECPCMPQYGLVCAFHLEREDEKESRGVEASIP